MHKEVVNSFQLTFAYEVVEYDALGTFAVQFQPHHIIGLEIGPHPSRRVNETASFHVLAQRLLRDDARADEPRVVKIHLHIGVPPSGRDDFDPVVGKLSESRQARCGRLEDVDVIEGPALVPHFGQRLSEVSTDVEHDPARHGPIMADAASGALDVCASEEVLP